MTEKLIEVRIVKGVLFLTPEEFTRALKRGKAIKRRRSLNERIKETGPGQKALERRPQDV